MQPRKSPLHALNAARTGATCNLAPDKQLTAVDAFAEMTPVFRHPRCFNCHGNFDITDTNTHSGATSVPKDLDFRQPLTVPQRLQLHAQCAECHNQITGHGNRPTTAGNVIVSGWMIAPEPMQWVKAKDDEELCSLVKRHEENADSFVSHVTIDHGEIQFLKAAFEGRRALDAATMDTYDVVEERPPGSMQSLIAHGTRWAKLIGKHWKDSDDCGCVPPDVELTMRSEVTGTMQGMSTVGDFSAIVKLKDDTAGAVYRGTAPIKYGTFKYSMGSIPGCTMAYKPGTGTLEVTHVRFTSDQNGNTKISIGVRAEDERGAMAYTCYGRTVDRPIMALGSGWQTAHERDLVDRDYVFNDFEIVSNGSGAGGRTLIARKEISSSSQNVGPAAVHAKTTFELWALPK